jgi:hypothetical protein
VQATVRAAAAHSTGRARTGERHAVLAEWASARQNAAQVAAKPFRRMGSSSHAQEAAASVIATAASAGHSHGVAGRPPVIAAAIAITGQCHR